MAAEPSHSSSSAELDALRGAAAAGDARAKLALGSRLLVGDNAPFAQEEAVSLIASAAGAGEPEALNLLATLTGAGAWVAPNWPRALDLLAEAARLGSRDAATQLRLLVKDREWVASLDATPGMWRQMRERIDLEKFVIPPQPVQVSESPRVWTANGFATAEECDWLIARVQGKMTPAKMYNRARQAAAFDAIRTNSDYFFDIVNSGVLLVLLRVRISLMVSLPVPHMEPPQMLHYAPGQELRPHYDFLRDGANAYGKNDAYDGDRVVTFLLYLNEAYAGGETEFTKTGFRRKGAKGDAIFFANLAGGKPDRMSLHCGRPVESGEKWLLSQWIHDRPFTATLSS